MIINRYIYSLCIAILSVVFVFIIKTDLGRVIGINAPFLLFFSAIMISSWFGGITAGLLSIIFSSLICLFFYLPPYNSFSINSYITITELTIFSIEGLII